MSRPTVIIVGADKGGVGKTTVTRIVLDHLRNAGLDFRAFDAETPKGNLKRFFPDAQVVDLEHSDGQMAVFDNLTGSKVTVIDLAARQLSPTLKLLGDIGMLEAVRDGKLDVIVLHVLGSSVASFQEIAETAGAIKGSRYFIVTNHINDTAYFGWDSEDAQKALGLAEGIINVPKLDETAAEHVEQAAKPFADIAREYSSFVVKGKVATWLKGVLGALSVLKLGQ
jgi:hypothetical protein